MRNTKFFLSAALAEMLLLSALVTTDAVAAKAKIHASIQSAFGDKPVVINDYNEHLKEVVVDKANVYFATQDGRYIFAGPIFDTQRRVNIVTLQENELRQSYLSSLHKDTFVSYPSSSPNDYQVTVFTDIDCGYCRKLHTNMQRFNAVGISINYIMLPRSGVGSVSHKKTMSALCADNPALAINFAMQNGNVPTKSCEHSVMSQHLAIARDLQVNTTPTIVLPSGQIRLGLISPDQLLALLKESG